MRYFFDTEFIEDGRTLDLISIGIVSEDGRELYMQNRECDFDKASDWVRLNVCVNLQDFDIRTWSPRLSHPYGSATSKPWYTRAQIANEITHFVRAFPGATPEFREFWAYYADYDWVVLCQLFGTMMDLPKSFPMYCRDLRQMLDDRGLQNVTQPEDANTHNALIDARWVAQTWTQYHEAKETTPS